MSTSSRILSQSPPRDAMSDTSRTLSQSPPRDLTSTTSATLSQSPPQDPPSHQAPTRSLTPTLGPEIASNTAPYPSHTVVLCGDHCALVPLSLDHADELYEYLGGCDHEHMWDYMLSGPYLSLAEWREHVQDCIELSRNEEKGIMFWAVRVYDEPVTARFRPSDHYVLQQMETAEREDRQRTPTKAKVQDSSIDDSQDEGTQVDIPDGKHVGMLALHRIDLQNRVVEVGNVIFGAPLQGTVASTEVFCMLGTYVLETLGFRRWEWKCNDRNQPSKKSALRLGFQHEGLFRNHMIVKGRNRDTWWAAITEEEWEKDVKPGFVEWLKKDNFDEQWRQKMKLEEVRRDERAFKFEFELD